MGKLIDYEVVLNDNVNDQNIKDIINQYWDFDIDTRTFSTTVKNICEKYELGHYKLMNIVNTNCTVKASFGKCNRCEDDIIKEISSRNGVFHGSINIRGEHICNKCDNEEMEKRRLYHEQQRQIQKEREKEEREKEENAQKVIVQNLEEAFKNKNWLKLTKRQISILKNIILLDGDKKLIYKHIFNGNCYDKHVWHDIKAIENQNLIIVDRGYKGQVLMFRWLNDLGEFIKHYSIDDHNTNDKLKLYANKYKSTDQGFELYLKVDSQYLLSENDTIKLKMSFIDDNYVAEITKVYSNDDLPD